LQKDALAAAQSAAPPALPIPPVLQIGAFERTLAFAVTKRAPGVTLAALDDTALLALVPALFAALDALGQVDTRPFAGWGLTNAEGQGLFGSWPAYLHALHNQKFHYDWPALAQLPWWDQALFDAAYTALYF